MSMIYVIFAQAEPMCMTESLMALTEMAETRYPKLFEEVKYRSIGA